MKWLAMTILVCLMAEVFSEMEQAGSEEIEQVQAQRRHGGGHGHGHGHGMKTLHKLMKKLPPPPPVPPGGGPMWVPQPGMVLPLPYRIPPSPPFRYAPPPYYPPPKYETPPYVPPPFTGIAPPMSSPQYVPHHSRPQHPDP